MAELADRGRPIVAAEPNSPAAVQLLAIAKSLVEAAGTAPVSLPILRG
jgi:hypothetical protein